MRARRRRSATEAWPAMATAWPPVPPPSLRPPTPESAPQRDGGGVRACAGSGKGTPCVGPSGSAGAARRRSAMHGGPLGEGPCGAGFLGALRAAGEPARTGRGRLCGTEVCSKKVEEASEILQRRGRGAAGLQQKSVVRRKDEDVEAAQRRHCARHQQLDGAHLPWAEDQRQP